MIIVDTGPIVSALVSTDRFHHWAIEVMKGLRSPLLTCEAVLAETTYLVNKEGFDSTRVFTLLERRILQIGLRLDDEQSRVKALMQKYADQPMYLADACLVRMAELYPASRVLTVDRRDFSVYRKHRNQEIPCIMP